MTTEIDNREKKTNDTICARGMFENMTTIGFNTFDTLCEKVDNSIQEVSTVIQITVNKKDNLIIIADNGNGMDEDKLKNCGTVHRRSESTKDKHGRFGAGGNIADINLTNLGTAHYISRPNDGTEDVKEMKINYNVERFSDYVLHPHDASKKTCNLWDKYAIDKNGSGTVQILHSYPEKIGEIINGIDNNNIDESYRFSFGRMYNKQLKEGLKFEIRIEDIVYTISPIDLFKYDNIKTEDKDTSKILVWVDNGSYMFYYQFDDNNSLYYRDYSKSIKGKQEEMKETPTGIYIGDIEVESSYHPEWGVLIKPELDKMNIDSTKITKDKFRAKIGGIITERNNKQIAQFPSCETGVSSSLIPFYQGSHHNVKFKANETLDRLFGVLVNKSNLERKNINDHLNKTIKFLCDKFVTKMNKQYGDTKIEPPTTTAPVPPTATVPLVRTTTVSVPPVAPVTPTTTVPVTPTTTVPVPTLAPVQPTTAAPVQPTTTTPFQPASSSQVNPIHPLKPIVPLSPPSNIKMSKSENELIVTYKEKIIANIPYVGQYGITEKYYSAILTELGDERFAELINNDKKKGHFEDHRQFYFK
jgi:hypothetical protein